MASSADPHDRAPLVPGPLDRADVVERFAIRRRRYQPRPGALTSVLLFLLDRGTARERADAHHDSAKREDAVHSDRFRVIYDK